MYTRFFGLNEKPFSITPDPRYLFMSERHGEALAHLVYGVTESGGFIQLTGEVGTGKTTLVRTLLQKRMPNNADVAVVLNPQLSVHEFLATICEELGIDVPDDKGSIKALTDALNNHLLEAHAEGRRTILVVDEAQNLAPAVLEQVRLLTNLETAKQKLLQIILIGQPELRDLLGRNDLRQLAQRVTGRYHLEPLTRDESSQYIEHRLRVAGALGEIFDNSARKTVFRLSQGVPRLINVICDRALLGAYALEERRITKRIVRRAAREVSGELAASPWPVRIAVTLAAAVISVGIATFAAGIWPTPQEQTPIEAVAESIAPAIEIPVVMDTTHRHADTAQPDLLEQLTLAGELTGSDFAFASLLRLWNVEYTSGDRNGCLQSADAGLSCHHQRGSWRGLRQFDRPAILTLVDDEGRSHEVVLVALHDDLAELSIGGVTVTHPVPAITDIWYGQSLLLWRPPYGKRMSLAPGSRGPRVIWLRESLASIDSRYETAEADSDLFGSALEDVVRQFQRDHRLDVDGLVGQQTQIIINSLLTLDGTPRLSSARLAQD